MIDGLKGLNTPITLLFKQASPDHRDSFRQGGLQKPVICLDGLDQVDFDFVDIGEVINQTGLVPVVEVILLIVDPS